MGFHLNGITDGGIEVCKLNMELMDLWLKKENEI